jgi:uncharacterized protein (TIGR02246 family)
MSSAQSDADSIRALIREWETAYNNHDAQKVLSCWDEDGVIATGPMKKVLTKEEYANYLPMRFEQVPKLEVKEIGDISVSTSKGKVTIQLRNYPSETTKWKGKKEFSVTFMLLKGQDKNYRFQAWDY